MSSFEERWAEQQKQYEERQKFIGTRNPYESLQKYPITKEMLEPLRARLGTLWEDTTFETPGGVSLGVGAGTLVHILTLAIKAAPKE